MAKDGFSQDLGRAKRPPGCELLPVQQHAGLGSHEEHVLASSPGDAHQVADSSSAVRQHPVSGGVQQALPERVLLKRALSPSHLLVEALHRAATEGVCAGEEDVVRARPGDVQEGCCLRPPRGCLCRRSGGQCCPSRCSRAPPFPPGRGSAGPGPRRHRRQAPGAVASRWRRCCRCRSGGSTASPL